MRTLLTGGTGYIGSHVAVELQRQGHDCVLLDNLSNSDRSVVDQLARITNREQVFVEADIRDTDTLAATLSDHRIEAVIHFAGLKAVGESVEKPLLYFNTNVGGTVSLLEAMQAEGVKRFVFSSSATVYGTPQYLPYDEAHPTAPENPYGRTKLQIEEMLAAVCASDPDFTAFCLRYFNPVGAHQSALIGENPSGIPNNLMPYVAKVATGELAEIQVLGDDYDTPDGTGVRDYIHVDDLAEGHVAALDASARETGWHAVNLGTGTGTSVLEMVSAFEAACGKTLPRRIAPRRAGDLPAFWANPHKAADMLGWQASRTVDDMCRTVWAYNQRRAGD